MPNKKNAIKALRQSNKRAERNKQVKDSIAYLRRSLRKAVEAKDADKAGSVSKDTIKAVDKAVQNNVIKKNTGARIKSRLMKKVNAVKAEASAKK
jgi:small subunit ribosomal protein S20